MLKKCVYRGLNSSVASVTTNCRFLNLIFIFIHEWSCSWLRIPVYRALTSILSGGEEVVMLSNRSESTPGDLGERRAWHQSLERRECVLRNLTERKEVWFTATFAGGRLVGSESRARRHIRLSGRRGNKERAAVLHPMETCSPARSRISIRILFPNRHAERDTIEWNTHRDVHMFFFSTNY